MVYTRFYHTQLNYWVGTKLNTQLSWHPLYEVQLCTRF